MLENVNLLEVFTAVGVLFNGVVIFMVNSKLDKHTGRVDAP